jgi:glutamine synthetase
MADVPFPASELRRRLEAAGVRLLGTTMVDNGGITRIKLVPVARLESVARAGVGMSNVWATAAVDDHFASTPAFDSPSGDMRLIPDLRRARPLAGAPGYAWAPADQYDQDLRRMPNDQRAALERAVERAAAAGLSFRATFEVEFTLLDADGRPGHDGPGYSPRALLPFEPFALDLLDALTAEEIAVEQLHPEYAPGQFEVSVAPSDPVAAADDLVLLRLTVRQVARRHGYQASFAPAVLPGEVGNGSHLHVSVWRDGQNAMTGLEAGARGDGAAAAAGVLAHLHELLAVLAPSVPSYARLRPSHWAGAYACWGVENRESALRFIPGTAGTRERSANLEVKVVDGAANPYLAATAVIAAATGGVERRLELPAPVQVDPAGMEERERAEHGVERLAETLAAATDALAGSDLLRRAFGDELFEAFVAVRRLEWETYGGADEETLAAAHRWRYG